MNLHSSGTSRNVQGGTSRTDADRRSEADDPLARRTAAHPAQRRYRARRQACASRPSDSRRDVDWSRLAETLRMRRLLPDPGSAHPGAGGESASDELRAAVEQAIDAGRQQGAFLQLVSLRVTAMLADAGIRCAPLKGPLLGEAIYGDPGRRLSSDVDLLVAPEQLRAAVEVVRALGYGAPTDYVGEDGSAAAALRARPRARGVAAGGAPLAYPLVRARALRASGSCRRRSIRRAIGARSRRRARRAAAVLRARRLCRPAPGHRPGRLVGSSMASELPRGALEELLSAYPALARVIPAARRGWREGGGPAGGADHRGHAQAGSSRSRGCRLANPNPQAGQSQIYADMGLIDGLLAPPGGFRSFVRRQVLLPRGVLDELDRYAPKRWARSSVVRGAGVVGRYGLTMARLARTPETLIKGLSR